MEADPKAVSTGVPAWIVAEQILWLRGERGAETTQFQLQKLIYIAHGWMLGLTGKPLILDPIFAWDYGPVILDIWHRYREFEARPITLPTVDRSDFLIGDQADLIATVVEVYDYSFQELFAITHHEETPWSQVFRQGEGKNQRIPDELIEAHYRALAGEPE